MSVSEYSFFLVLFPGIIYFVYSRFVLLTSKKGCCRVVAIIQQRTWTNENAKNNLSFLQSLPMHLCALETRIRIATNLEKFVDLNKKHRSGPEPSPCPLQAQASGPKILGYLIVGCNGSA